MYLTTEIQFELTKLQGCYSPALSQTSRRAKIRTTNEKESKEKRNREKLLAGPGSEFSLANPEDLEMDYYDYNVTNAGAAPGSYLGMDPAYLIWIPPLEPGEYPEENSDEDGSTTAEEPHYEEILPRHQDIDPGSNTETPDEDSSPPLPLMSSKASSKELERQSSRLNIKESIPLQEFKTNKTVIISSSSVSAAASSSFCQTARDNRLVGVESSEDDNEMLEEEVGEEKETSVIKSPKEKQKAIQKTYQNYYDQLDDIQFADDEEVEYTTPGQLHLRA